MIAPLTSADLHIELASLQRQLMTPMAPQLT